MRRDGLRGKRRIEYEGNQWLLVRVPVQDQHSWTTTAPSLICPGLSSASGSCHLFWCIWVTLILCQEDMTLHSACKTSQNGQEPSFILQTWTHAWLHMLKPLEMCVGFQPAPIMAASLKQPADLRLNSISLISPHQSRWIEISNLLSCRLLQG